MDVAFNITFNGTDEEYPNYFGFLTMDFNDSSSVKRFIEFEPDPSGFYFEMEVHLYESYGTYYPHLVMFNNISEVDWNFTIEVEQCVMDFEIFFDNERYFYYYELPNRA